MTKGEKAKKLVDEAVQGKKVLLQVTGIFRHFAVTEDAIYIGSVTQPTIIGFYNGQSLKTIPLEALSMVKVHRQDSVILEFVVMGTPEVQQINDVMVRLTNENLIELPRNQASSVQQVVDQILEIRGKKGPSGSENVAELIEHLAKLKGAGALTQAEFEQKKQQLLQRM